MAQTNASAPPQASSAAPSTSTGQRPASLNWVRGPGADACPGPAAIANAVETQLHRPVFVPASRPELAVEAYVEGNAPVGFKVIIRMSGPEGELLGRREFTSDAPDCASVIDSAVLAIALMIDPEASLAAEAKAPVSAPQASAPPPPVAPQVFLLPAPQPVLAPVQPRPEPPWTAAIDATVAFALGIVPNLAPAFSLRGRVVPPQQLVGFEIGGTLVSQERREVRAASPTAPAAGGDFSALLFHVATCWLPDGGDGLLAVLFCGGADIGSLAAQGYGFRTAPSEKDLLFDLSLRSSIGLRIFPHGLVQLGASLAVPTRRDKFEVSLGGVRQPVYQRPALGGLGEIGVGIEF